MTKKKVERLQPLQATMLLNCICKDIINGYTMRSVVSKLKKNGYNGLKTEHLGNDALEGYYREAVRDLRVEFGNEREKLRDAAYERYLNIYKTSMEANDRTNAINSLKEMSRLLGLNNPDTVQVNNHIIVDFGFDESDDESETDQKSEESVEAVSD